MGLFLLHIWRKYDITNIRKIKNIRIIIYTRKSYRQPKQGGGVNNGGNE